MGHKFNYTITLGYPTIRITYQNQLVPTHDVDEVVEDDAAEESEVERGWELAKEAVAADVAQLPRHEPMLRWYTHSYSLTGVYIIR